MTRNSLKNVQHLGFSDSFPIRVYFFDFRTTYPHLNVSWISLQNMRIKQECTFIDYFLPIVNSYTRLKCMLHQHCSKIMMSCCIFSVKIQNKCLDCKCEPMTLFFFMPWIANKPRLVRSFLGRIYSAPICLLFYLTFSLGQKSSVLCMMHCPNGS